MQKFFTSIGAIAALCLLSTPISAQEAQGCFMINSQGRFVSLSSMCPQPQPIAGSAQQATAQSATTQSPSQDLRPIAYADAYCQARKDGYPDDIARKRGVSAMQDIAIAQDGSVAAYLAHPIEHSVIVEALSDVSQMCPEFK